MSEREAFGPNLRRARIQRGITLEQIAASTKISSDLWAAMERNDFSRWPAGIYARAYLRAYTAEIGVSPDAIVDEFCRFFPQGDRRAERVVREQAAMMGHDLRWKDDLLGHVVDSDRRASPTPDLDIPPLAFSQTGRIVAALADLGVIIGAALGVAAILPIGKVTALAVCAVSYHAVALATLGCTPAVWGIETYLAHRHPSAARGTPRFFRLLRGSERVASERVKV
jgi:transcriptional regulator with XRE-family HTH domain